MTSTPSPDPASGTWLIAGSTLSMWRSRRSPSVTYAPLPGGDLMDVVQFTGPRGPSRIFGVDRPQPDGSYLWRGVTPLTSLASSRWRFADVGEGWAITRFARTIFTPAGWDIYVRDQSVDLTIAEERLNRLGGDEAYFRTRHRH